VRLTDKEKWGEHLEYNRKWNEWYREAKKTARCKHCGKKLQAPDSIRARTCVACRNEYYAVKNEKRKRGDEP